MTDNNVNDDHSHWWLYLLDCDGRLYTGISTDPDRRYQEHLAGGAKAARFVRASKRVEMRYRVKIGEHSLALRLEYQIKRLARQQKLAIVAHQPDLPQLMVLLEL